MRIPLSCAALILSSALAPSALAAGDPAKGKAVFAPCRMCHSLEKSGKSSLGPNLHKIVNRPVASIAGFAYSPAMKRQAGRWTAERLNAYIAAPAKAVPGNRMIYAGMRNPADRDNLLAYLAHPER